jgi:hypothetical protein
MLEGEPRFASIVSNNLLNGAAVGAHGCALLPLLTLMCRIPSIGHSQLLHGFIQPAEQVRILVRVFACEDYTPWAAPPA